MINERNIIKSLGKRSIRLLAVAGVFLLSSYITGFVAQAAEIEEVIVTATKRTESIQDIAASISAISSDELEARRVTEFFDYAITIPNLSFGATDDGVLSGKTISLRGVQGENTTGVYINDTPLSETINPRILDLERIEVLRGPTGTLYGARSLGGTIRLITRKPNHEAVSGKVDLSFSTTNESGGINYLGKFSLNIPVVENMALLISGFSEKQDGVYDRVFGDIADPFAAPATLAGEPTRIVEDVDSKSVVAFQLDLLWQLTESLSFEPRVLYQKVLLDGFPLSDQSSEGAFPGGFDQNRDVNVDALEGGVDEWILYTLNAEYDFADLGTLTWAVSYFDRNTDEYEESGEFINWLQLLPDEFGGFELPLEGFRQLSSPIFQVLENTSFTNELRFSSNLTGKFNFVAGAFYQQIDSRQAYDPPNIATGLVDNLLGAGFPADIRLFQVIGEDLIFTSNTLSNVRDLGIFGEVIVYLNDALSFTVGGRFYNVEVDFVDRRAGLAASIPLAPDGLISSVDPITDDTQSENGFNFKVAVEYAIAENVLLYGQVAEGFRIGGVNEFTPPDTAPDDDLLGCLIEAEATGLTEFNKTTFESDQLISYEVGIKSDISTHSRLNVALFHIDISNIQQRFPFSCGFPLTANFGDAVSQGVEVEFLSRPLDGLTLGFNFGYTSARFSEDFGNDFINAGDPLQQVPKVTVSATVEYVRPDVFSGVDFFVRGDGSFIGDSITRTNSSSDEPTRDRESYEQINFRIGLEKERWTVALFARNLTNNIANIGDNRSIAAETPGRIRFVVSRPRTVGIDLQYRF